MNPKEIKIYQAVLKGNITDFNFALLNNNNLPKYFLHNLVYLKIVNSWIIMQDVIERVDVNYSDKMVIRHFTF